MNGDSTERSTYTSPTYAGLSSAVVILDRTTIIPVYNPIPPAPATTRPMINMSML